ncbi:uncharacterized protein BKA78DRAFT_324630 [Phyllosticta capitalensis]|uniref:uncharacterized protein n=1 Tax=Phyllosticta capitalensis TaxID=121624 RepID=UPI00313056F0
MLRREEACEGGAVGGMRDWMKVREGRGRVAGRPSNAVGAVFCCRKRGGTAGRSPRPTPCVVSGAVGGTAPWMVELDDGVIVAHNSIGSPFCCRDCGGTAGRSPRPTPCVVSGAVGGTAP